MQPGGGLSAARKAFLAMVVPGSRKEEYRPGPSPSGEGSRPGRAVWLGSMSYGESQALQNDLTSRRAAGKIPDTILLLQHPHTYTIGAHGLPESFPSNREELEERGVSFYLSERGGDVTYHGPGQLVCYPIIDLNNRGLDLRGYVRDLEEVIISALRMFAVFGKRMPGYPGVWVGGEKIAAIGIKVDRRGITSHGLSLNVDCDLDYFSLIVPCGIKDKGVTSMKKILGTAPSMGDVRDSITEAFEKVFQISAKRSIAKVSSAGRIFLDA